MKRSLLITGALAGICLSASASVIVQWDFNSTPSDNSATTGTLTPSLGQGTAVGVGGVVTTYNAPSGGSDPLLADPNNSCWKLATFPAQGSGNKTAGTQFNFDTTGYENIVMNWDHINSPQGNKYWRIQYSVDNGATWVDKDVYVNPASGVWSAWSADFSTVPGANNNTNFGVRLVSEFQSTAVGGADVYVAAATGYAYTPAGVLRLEMVTFSGTPGTGQVNILADPTNQVVAAGQPASFYVAAGGGSSPIRYQWRHGTLAIDGATNALYQIEATTLADAGSYDVIVANSVNSRTSAVATLEVRQSLHLAWSGQNSYWDTAGVSWINTSSQASAAYSTGDHVLFDSRGAAIPWIYLAGTLTPSSITVDANFDYTFLDGGGSIAGSTGLTKLGTGSLLVALDNSYSGPTLIEAGTVQVGVADVYGSLGSGPVTNNSVLLFNRAGTTTVPNTIISAGSITNWGTNVTLAGPNVYSGPIVAHAGTLTLLGNQTVNSPHIYSFPSTATGASGATKLGISSGTVLGAGTTVHLSQTDGTADLRSTFYAKGGSNTVNGPFVLDGNGVAAIQCEGVGSELYINGNVSGAGFTGSLYLRGPNGLGFLNGTISLPGLPVNKTESGIWTINSTGNSWATTTIAQGTIRVGANNALPTGLSLIMGASATSTLDLGGFNQQISVLQDSGMVTRITNSSAIADSTLTVGSGSFMGSICDGASHKTSLTVNGGTLTLSGTNSYSGVTTVAAGTLGLAGDGSIENSTVIDLAGGGLDVSARNDATLTLATNQTLKGNGTLNITGNLVNNGTVQLKVNKAGGVVSADKVAVSGQAVYGGTLRLVLGGQGLGPADVLTLFSAGSYSGASFATIEPAEPGPGLTWDTSTLGIDGKLRLSGTAAPTISATVLSPGGTEFVFSGTGGAPGGSFSVLATTNLSASAVWSPVKTGSFDSTGNFSVTNAVVPGVPQQLFRLQVP